MRKLSEKSDIRLLAFLAFLVNFASYLARINFAAVIVEFVQAENVAKSDASLITSVLFITYGAGQLISGFLGDRFSPRRLIFWGLLLATTCNFLMPVFAPSIGVMAVLWGFNGLGHACMWPPLVKIMTCALRKEDYARMVPMIGVSSSCATILIFLLAPVLIGVSGWRAIFIFSGTAAFLAAFFWLISSGRLLKGMDFTQVEEKKTEVSTGGPSRYERSLMLLLPVIMITISLQGMLRDGISTWMPTLISESFQVESTVSILTGVALPLFHMMVSLMVYPILRRMNHNVFGCIVMFFAFVVGLTASLYLFGMHSMVMSLVLIALTNGLVNGINVLQTGYIPNLFKSSGKISFLAGLLNSATYVGSALSTYLFAVISEQHGWNATVLSWVAVSGAGLLLTYGCIAFLRARKCSVVG